MPFDQVGDLQMYWERHGTGDPVLFINGTGGDLRLISPLHAHPLSRRFDALYYDQRGLGQTSIPDGPYSMQQYGDDAARLIEQIGWTRCHVVGVSFGGMVAQELAVRHPHLVDRLVLCCTSSGGDGGSSSDLLQLEDLPRDEALAKRVAVFDNRNDTTTEPWTIAPGMELPVQLMRSAPAPSPEAARGARLQLEARAFHDTWDRLPAFDRPTLVIGGRFDGQAPPANLERLADRLPNAVLHLCDGGHLFLLQDQSAWPTIVAFLRGALARRDADGEVD
jgi:3-oxoadipate enol-lactonase